MSQINKTLFAVFTSATVGATGYLIYESFWGDDSPIYTGSGYANLSKTKEKFAPGSIGSVFPYYFLSTRAVSNKSTWEARAETIRKKESWTGKSVFAGIDNKSFYLVEEIKAACKRAYKLPAPKFSNGEDKVIWITREEWKDIFNICRRV